MSTITVNFDYYIKRKSDGKIVAILHDSVSEDEVTELVRSRMEAPTNYSMDDGDGNGEYEFVDLVISSIETSA